MTNAEEVLDALSTDCRMAASGKCHRHDAWALVASMETIVAHGATPGKRKRWFCPVSGELMSTRRQRRGERRQLLRAQTTVDNTHIP